MKYSSICLALPTLISSLHTDRIGIDAVAEADEAGGPHPKRGEFLPHPPSTPRPPSEKRPAPPTLKPTANPYGFFQGPFSFFGKATTPEPAATTPAAAAPKAAARKRKGATNPFENPEVKRQAAARLNSYVQQLREKKKQVMKQVEDESKPSRFPFMKKEKKKGIRIMTISELFGLPTIDEMNTAFATADAVTTEVDKAAKLAVKAMINITDSTQWLPDVLPQVSHAVEKFATPFGGPRTPPWGHNGLDYDTEKLAVEIVKKKQMLEAMKGGGGDENSLESATSMFCENSMEAILHEGVTAEVAKLTMIGDSVFEALKGTTCSIPLKGLCESQRPDKRGCDKEDKFKKFFSNEFAPPVNPQRKSMVPVTDEFPQYMPGIKPLILASAGMRFQEAAKLITDLLDEGFHSSVYYMYLGMNNLLDQEGMELAQDNFMKLAKLLKDKLPYSIVMWHPLLPCEKCVPFGVTDETILEFNAFMVKHLKELDATGKRRFWIVDCTEEFREDEEATEQMEESTGAELPPKLMDDGKHPNKLGHETWLKCWGPKVDAAVVAMKNAGLVHSLVVEDDAKKVADAAQATASDQGEKLLDIKTKIGPNGELIYLGEDGEPLDEEEVAELKAKMMKVNVTALKNKTNSTVAKATAAAKDKAPAAAAAAKKVAAKVPAKSR